MFKINNKNIQKIKYFSLGLITSSLLFSSVTFADNSAIKIYLNGKLLENAEVINVNNSTYLPVRKLCEALKMKVNFDAVNNSVIIDSSGIKLDSNIEDKQINNNQEIEILKDYPEILYKYPIKYNNNIYFTIVDGCKKYNIDKNNVEYNQNKKEILFKKTNMIIDTTNKEYVIFYNGINYINENIFKNNQ